MKLKIKIEIEADNPKDFRRYVNEAIRRLALTSEYDIANASQVTTEPCGMFSVDQSTEVVPNDVTKEAK